MPLVAASERDGEFMRVALEEAQQGFDEGGVPVGSVLVLDGRVVARGHNRRVQEGDPIALAGVGERMARAAGEVADGFHVHPVHSPGYLRDVVRPAVAEGARAAGRDPAKVDLIAPVFLVTGATEAERAEAESDARRQIAFYASTPTYRPFLAYHGCEALGKELSALARAGNFADMPARVPDALLDAVAVSAAPAGVGAALRARYAGDLVQRLYPYMPIPADDPAGRLAALVAGIKSA
jgi:probable F420-dependent oxidoreductase